MNVLRPGDPSDTDFDPSEAQALAGKAIAAGTTIFAEGIPAEAVAMAAFAQTLVPLPTDVLETMGALISAEISSRP